MRRLLGVFLSCALLVVGNVQVALAGDIAAYVAYYTAQGGSSSTGVGIKGSVPLVEELLYAELRAAYHGDVSGSRMPNVNFVPLEAGVSIVGAFEHRFIPYASAGLGYYNMDISGGGTKGKGGGYILGGLNFEVWQQINIFGEVYYRHVDAIKVSNRSGGRLELKGGGGNVGLAYRW